MTKAITFFFFPLWFEFATLLQANASVIFAVENEGYVSPVAMTISTTTMIDKPVS